MVVRCPIQAAVRAFIVLSALSLLPQTLALPAADVPHSGNSKRFSSAVEDLLSQMTFREQLAQTRNVGGVLRADGTYDSAALDSFNDGYGGGSISYGDYSNSIWTAAATVSDIIVNKTATNRLHIPMINVADSVSGLTLLNATLFPASLSLGQSWNIPLFSQVVEAISIENRAVGIHWVFSPELDLAREPRYGRVGEMYGEDPYHVSRYGVAYVKNMQAEQANGTMRVAATVKHFIYGSSEGGVNIAPMAGGINDFYNIYSVPFRAVIKEANPASLMPAYAAYDGVPAHGSTQYTHDFLRGELGFQGVVTSDFVGISDLHEAHAVCDSITAAGLLAMQVGIDHEIGVPAERAGFQMLSTLADDPEVQALVKQAAGRILTMKMLTGTFDQPTPDLSKINSTVRTPEHQALNLNVSKETMVLLKNDGLLPIAVGSDLLSNVAVIGPLAQFISDGSYAATDFITGSTILRGIQSIAKTATYSVGCTINDAAASAAQISAAVSVAQAAKLAVVVVGSSSSNLPGVYRTDGEGIDHALLDFPAPQNDMLAAIVATGVPVLVVVSGGQAFEMDYAAENANALIHTFLQGEEGGNALASIITGETNPSGKLSVSIPHLSSEIPIFYNNLPTAHKLGWPYYDWQYPLNQRTARYPFGYGLSYTSFSFSGVSVATASTTGSISVSATITNSGAVKGKEVVQVYYGQAFARIERPYKNLIRFDKIELEAGASQTVSFDIPVEEMGYYVNGKKFVDAGTYYVWVGSSSAAVDLVMTTIVVT